MYRYQIISPKTIARLPDVKWSSKVWYKRELTRASQEFLTI